jgi:hypothetical protein
MKHDALLDDGPGYAPCRYGASRLLFRGPRRPLDGRHVAFVGGTETFGKFLDAPFPALVEEMTGLPCVNLGQANGSVDVMLGDETVLAACRDAQLTVVQVTGAPNMSNRFYTVHPRRNDRFLRASSVLRAIFPEVDFTDFCFTRHLLTQLHAAAPDRFAILSEELQAAWLARQRTFLTAIGPKTILLWFSSHLPSDVPWEERENPLGIEPLFVTRRMIDSLRPLVRAVVMVQPSVRAALPAREGLAPSPAEAAAAAAGLMGAAAHREAARALADAIRVAMGHGPTDGPMDRPVAERVGPPR